MDVGSTVVIVGYLVAVTLIGSALARRANSSKQWAVAGGGMSMAMVAVGVAGTRIGGAGTYGVAERAMSGGLWYMWWYAINTFLAITIVGVFFARAYRRLELRTVGEIFNRRFGSQRCQVVTSLCVQTEYLIVNIIEAYIIGAILAQLTGMPMLAGVACAAAVLITYTALGGLWGSSATNLIHCVVILLGLAAVGVRGTEHLGGWDAVLGAVDGHLASSEHTPQAWWGFAGAGWGAVLGMFFSAAIHTPAASVYTNFSTAARSERSLIPAFLLAGLIASLMPLLAGYVGILTLANYGLDAGLAGYRNLTQLAMDLHPMIGGVALAAILAAVISSGGPILLASATMFVNDWLPRVRDAAPERTLRAYRVATLVYGIVSAGIAYLVAQTTVSLLDLLLFGFAMVCPPAVAVALVIYWRRTTEAACYWGMLAGYGGGLVWFLLIKWALYIEFTVDAHAGLAQRVFHYLFVHTGQGVDPSYATTLIPLVVIPTVSLLQSAHVTDARSFYAQIKGQAAPLESLTQPHVNT